MVLKGFTTDPDEQVLLSNGEKKYSKEELAALNKKGYITVEQMRNSVHEKFPIAHTVIMEPFTLDENGEVIGLEAKWGFNLFRVSTCRADGAVCEAVVDYRLDKRYHALFLRQETGKREEGKILLVNGLPVVGKVVVEEYKKIVVAKWNSGVNQNNFLELRLGSLTKDEEENVDFLHPAEDLELKGLLSADPQRIDGFIAIYLRKTVGVPVPDEPKGEFIVGVPEILDTKNGTLAIDGRSAGALAICNLL